MADEELYRDGDVVITPSTLAHGGNYYPLSSIKSVVHFKEPLDVKGLLINAVMALAGLYGLSTFSTLGVILGLLAVGVCGFNLYNFYIDMSNPQYIVAIEFHSGESIYIKRRDMEWARRLHDAVHGAMKR